MTDDVSHCSFSRERLTLLQKEVLNELTTVLTDLEQRRQSMASTVMIHWEAARLVSSQNLG